MDQKGGAATIIGVVVAIVAVGAFFGYYFLMRGEESITYTGDIVSVSGPSTVNMGDTFTLRIFVMGEPSGNFNLYIYGPIPYYFDLSWTNRDVYLTPQLERIDVLVTMESVELMSYPTQQTIRVHLHDPNGTTCDSVDYYFQIVGGSA